MRFRGLPPLDAAVRPDCHRPPVHAVNLGDKRADIITKLGNTKSMIISFQVVRVHKPLLVLSRLVEAGHQVHFNKLEPNILFASREKVLMPCRDGIYEIEMWVCNQDFARPAR